MNNIKRASSTDYSLVYSITHAENTRIAGQCKRKYNTMAGQHSVSKYYCHQLLPMVYELNKSYTKKITIGLENKKIGGEFLPVVRLSADDFVGIPLTVSDWRLFEENFLIIEKFFETEDGDMLDKKIPFSHFRIRLIISFGDKAFELVEEENSQTSDQPPTKQYRRCLIFKKVTFDILKIL